MIESHSWTSEAFEHRITAATVALYESRTDPECHVRGISNFDASVFLKMRKHGVYITAPDRVCVSPEYGASVLRWPSVGCISLGSQYKGQGLPDDLIESYCRLFYFRKLNKLPAHSAMIANGDPYELVMAWPQDNGPVIGATRYLTVNRRTGIVSPTVAVWNKNNNAIVRDIMSEQTDAFALSVALQFTDDSRHIWTITAQNDVSRVTVGAYSDCVKSLLYARSLPVTASGRKRPILHVVHAHRRRLKNGIDVQIGDFLRGSMEVVMNDTKYTVAAPRTLIEELATKSKSGK
jgi:hypothetical protein